MTKEDKFLLSILEAGISLIITFFITLYIIRLTY